MDIHDGLEELERRDPMMPDFFLLAPLVLYAFALLVIAGWVVYRHEAASALQFLKGTSNYRSPILIVTLLATFIGPGYSLGVIDSTYALAWTFGLAVACTPLHMIITGLFLLKSSAARKITSYSTTGEMVEDTFGRNARPIFAITLVILYTLFVGQLLSGSVVILESIYGVSGELLVLFMALLVGSYSITGGIPGVVRTDIIQVFFLAVLMIFFITIALSIQEVLPSTSIESSPATEIAEFNFPLFVSIALVFLLGDAFQPVYMQRAYFAATNRDAGRAFLAAGCIAIFWFLILTWVGVTIASHPDFSGSGQGIIISALKTVASNDVVWLNVLLGLIGVAFMGVVMSTLDSVLNTASGTLIEDAVGRWFELDDGMAVSLMKVGIFVIAVMGAMIASVQPNMVELLISAYEFWIATGLAIVLMSLLATGRRVFVPTGVLIIGVAVGIGFWSLSLFLKDPTVPWAVIGFLANLAVIIVAASVAGGLFSPVDEET